MNLHQHLSAYLERVRAERTYTQATLKSYSHRLRVFVAWLGAEAEAFAFTAEAIDSYKLHLLQSSQPTTVCATLCAIRSFGEYLVKQKAIPENPAKVVPMPKRNPPKRKYVSDVEAAAMLQACERIADPRRSALARAVVATLLYSGVRRAELLSVQMDDLHLSDGFFVVQYGKGGKVRLAVPHPDALAALAAWLPWRPEDCLHPYVFAISRHERLGDNGLRKLLRDVAAIAGYKGATNLTPHPMRRNYATRMSRKADVFAVRDLMGHSSVKTTELYVGPSLDHLKEVAQRGTLPMTPSEPSPTAPIQSPTPSVPAPAPPQAPSQPAEIEIRRRAKAAWRRHLLERDH